MIYYNMKTHVIYSLKTKEYLTGGGWWSEDINEAFTFIKLEPAESFIKLGNLSFVEIKTIYI